MRRLALTFLAAVGLIGLGACGGTVGNDGNDPEVVCQELCKSREEHNCDSGGGSCVADCVESFDAVPAECRDEYAASLDCDATLIKLAGCMPIDGCESELDALLECAEDPT